MPLLAVLLSALGLTAGRAQVGSDRLERGVRGFIAALDADTGEIRWHFQFTPGDPYDFDLVLAVLQSADRAVLHPGMGRPRLDIQSGAAGVRAGARSGYFQALDARSGELLWKLNLGAQIVNGPMTYEVAGRQYVAIVAGQSLSAFALRD